ncbi:unnamed protein product [Penicillium viridicatum]
MPAPEGPKSVVELLHEVLLAPSWMDRVLQALFCLVFMFCWKVVTTAAELVRAWAFSSWGPPNHSTPPPNPPTTPSCSDIRVVADMPPAPPTHPPHAVRNRDRVSSSPTGSLRRRLRRSILPQPITLGHPVSCICAGCENRRFNRMDTMEEV